MTKVVRKGLILSLSAVMLLSTSFVNANAAAKGKTAAVVKKVEKKVEKKAENKLEKIQPQKLEAVVEAVYEMDMKVEDKDGKSYIVPIGVFSKMDGFKDLKLSPGTKVVLEGFQPIVHKTIIRKGDVLPADVPEPGKDIIIKEFKDDDIISKEAVENDKPNVIFHRKAVSADKDIKAESGTFNIKLDGPEQVRIPLKVNILKPIDGSLFIANSITANGKTVKLDKTAGPTKIMIKKQ